MTTIASLIVSLGMDTAKFVAGAKRSKEETDSLINSIAGNSFQLASRAYGGLSGYAMQAAEKAAMLTFETMKEVDTLDELAQQAGTTATALSELQYAAKFTGAESELIAPALDKLIIKLGQIQEGADDSAFRRLALDANKLASLDTSEAFREIADRISALPSQTERAAAAMDIFGKSGAKLLNVLSAGRDEIDRLGQTARDIGFAPEDTAVAKVAAAAEAYDRLTAHLKALKNQSIGAMPAFEALSSSAVSVLRELNTGKDSLDGYANAFGRFRQIFVDDWGSEFRNFKGRAEEIMAEKKAMEDVARRAQDLAKWQKVATDEVARRRALEEETNANINGFVDSIQKQIDGYKSLEERAAGFAAFANAQQSAAIRSAVEQLAWHKRITEQQELQKRAAQEQLELAKKAAEARERSMEAIRDRASARDLSTPLQKRNQALQEMMEEARRGFLSQDQLRLGILHAQRDFLSTMPATQQLPDTRAGALERGTAAAFSASFGPIAKPLDRLVQLEKEILRHMRNMDANIVQGMVRRHGGI